ncbi:MAG: UDP-N-acetylglucosamine 1-carboxyvinyltransferase [Tepidiformaceae bacterium]
MSSRRTTGERYIVQGPAILRGSIRTSGAKNHALAAMCAALLTDEPVVLTNVPDLSDTSSIAELLHSLGATIDYRPGVSMTICAKGLSTVEAPTELISENRASFQVMGPLLARQGMAACAEPGGDSIGQRPIEVHLGGFRALGAIVERDGGRWLAKAPDGPGSLRGTRVFMDYPSVSGTQNVMMAAVLAVGRTTIVNAATEPEVQELAGLLKAMGAKIDGVGTQMLEIEGVTELHGAHYPIMPDRIEAGTFAVAAAMTGGHVRIEDAPVDVMEGLIAKLRLAGATIETVGERCIEVSREGDLYPLNFQALPYPGIATDVQAPLTTMLTQAHGVSSVYERVFDNRMLYVGELQKMGADIRSLGSQAIVTGPTKLDGTRVHALDVRAGAAVLLAGLVARGTTTIEDIYHLDRGYERLDEKLRALGARVERA